MLLLCTLLCNYNHALSNYVQRKSIAPFRKGGQSSGLRSILHAPGMDQYDSLCDLYYVVVQAVFVWLASMPDAPKSLSVPSLLAACHANGSTFACMQFVFMPGGGIDFWKFRGQALRVSDPVS